ncbi:plasma-membrane choline transporter-domain-containing protein [Leucosporidium creatinivorum]|uniref:Protein PNS1 n=1 Tax=Leucosporidium creatinivorum TaxID=106004 RepID=A0A1Y2DDR0_9BASI|nr:plasma-membrane choline transporter-domain-containing protein [Leucosporidium creatinivorum]
MASNFASYASHLLSQSQATTSAPLFYSTRDVFTPAIDPEDDILGASASLEDMDHHHHHQRGRQLSFGSLDDGRPDDDEDEQQPPSASLMGVPAFMSRLSAAPACFSRGWRAHESVLPQHHEHAYLDDDDHDSTSDLSADESSPPGAFLSTPLHHPPPTGSTTEPLIAPRTLFVYPVQGQAAGGGVRAQGAYRDSHWIVIYGLSVILVLVLGVVEWWKSPVKISPPPATPSPDSSIFSTIPILAILSFISLLAGFSSFSYILAVRHSMRHFIHAALLGGPLVFVGCGVVAFAGSFAGSGVAGDGGWKTGVRVFAAGCFLLAYVLARQAVKRRKQVARAIAIGELATQTILEHPPLILLCLVLSVLSTIIALPFLLLLAGLLFDGVTSSGSLAGRGSFLTLLVYTWTLAILRGVQHAVVGGVVGTYYFERDGDSYPGAVQVVRAALSGLNSPYPCYDLADPLFAVGRATHQSLGTLIFASAVSSLATTLTTLLNSAKRALRSKHLHPLLQPLTYLVPLFSIITSAIASFNSYALAYAGMTGDDYLTSGREVVKMLRANETGSLGDSLLVRLVLLVTSVSWGLLAGLIAFLIASSRLQTGALAPVVAVLCFFVPLWTMKLCQDVCGDAVDSLFICMNLDLSRDTPSEGELQRKAAEAVSAVLEP